MSKFIPNVFRHGYERSADIAIERLHEIGKMVYVYLAPDGDVHVGTSRMLKRAETWALVGAYTPRTACAKDVEDDIREWLNERLAA